MGTGLALDHLCGFAKVCSPDERETLGVLPLFLFPIPGEGVDAQEIANVPLAKRRGSASLHLCLSMNAK